MPSYSDEELLDAIRELAEEYGRPPSLQEITDETKYGRKVFYTHFGSWRDALREAGYDPDVIQDGVGPPKLKEEVLLEDLRQLADELDKQPTQREMTEHGEHSHTTYVRHFGSWTEAIEAAFEDE